MNIVSIIKFEQNQWHISHSDSEQFIIEQFDRMKSQAGEKVS